MEAATTSAPEGVREARYFWSPMISETMEEGPTDKSFHCKGVQPLPEA